MQVHHNHLRNSWFIGRVEIQGDIPEPPNAGQLITASNLDLGQPFDKGALKTAADSMRKLMLSNGFYSSSVDYELEYDDTTQQVNISFTITARNQRARFAAPYVKSDNQVLTEQQIIRASRWHWILIPPVKQQVTLQRVNTGVEKIRVKLPEADNWLLATVTLDSLAYNEDDDNVSPQHFDQRGSDRRDQGHGRQNFQETRAARGPDLRGTTPSTAIF